VLPCAEILTVGLPFCVFKGLTGLIACGMSPAGYVLVALGLVDLGLNLVNLGYLLVARRRAGALCVLEFAFRGRQRTGGNLGLAVDMFFSFALVAIVVGAGLLPRLPAFALSLWNIAVVFNVLGAGAGRLVSALRTAYGDAASRPSGS
jgi:hypothetical protein